MTITKDIRYIGVNDHQIDLFEGQYAVPNGMAYNSYAILDEKIAIMDTVDKNFTQEWLGNVQGVLAGSPTIWWCSIWSPTTPPTSPASWQPIPRLWWSLLPRPLI